MLATEPAQGPFGHTKKVSSLHTRAHRGMSTFASPAVMPQPLKHASTSTKANTNGIQHDHLSNSGSNVSPQSSHCEFPQLDDNIMNRRADMNSSLFQICLGLRVRLSEVPGFAQHIAEMEEEEAEVEDFSDPVTSMWNCLRRGYPLMTLYNALKPAVPLKVDQTRVAEANIGKAATFKFLQACLTEQKFPSNECFLITDLYGGDTTGFVKVTKVVNRVLGILQHKGLLLSVEHKSTDEIEERMPQTLTYRQNVVKEIVMTERDYVQQLETLQQFKNEIEEIGAIAGDAVHDIFLNLNALLDFQRRFLIRIEQQNSLPESEQNWGYLFTQYKEAFRVYEPFIANQTRCNDAIVKEWDKLKAAALSPAVNGLLNTQHILAAFLLKPFTRLTKYPLLLSDLRAKGGLDEERKADLSKGIEAAQSILHRANDALDKEDRIAAVAELQGRVDDWKGHKVDHFGELLLYGNYTVLKGEGAREVEREYKVYLFERILLCCKEINPNKPKNRVLGNSRPLTDKKGKLRLQLKGRIFMQNVTDVVSLKNDKQLYTIQIYWKGDPGVENFVIRFATEETMIKWRDQVTTQKQILSNYGRSSGQSGTSDNKFTSLEKAALENPYLQEEDPDEDDSQGSTLVGGHDGLAASRNASNSSLRGAATLTGASMLPPTNRIRLPRHPHPDHGAGPTAAPLTLHTNILPAGLSPGAELGGTSYFSPTVESPKSSRSSSQANSYQFSPPGNPVSGWRKDDKNKHQTAPAMGRTPSRDGIGSPNFPIGGRILQGPSLTASQNAQYAALAQHRLRSASTPDIHNHNSVGPRRYMNGQQPPMDSNPVPPLPSNLPPYITQMRGPGNRSQTNSPVNGQSLIRSATQSPQLQREKGRHQPPQQDYEQFYPVKQLPQHQTNESRQAYQGIHHGMNSQVIAPSPLLGLASQTSPTSGIPYPSHLKVKIWFDPSPSHVTIVVTIVIKYQSLADRIDSKMTKITSASIASGTAVLRYRDDQDLVVIESDEDVRTAIETWGEVHEQALHDGKVPDFELLWREIGGTQTSQ